MDCKITNPTVSEFRGNKVISLPLTGAQHGFTFGLNKAKAILDCIEDIRAFVDAQSDIKSASNE